MFDNFYVDIHCHPTLKPYGQSFEKNGHNNPDRKQNDSIWYYNPPSLFDKLLNVLIKVTKFSQSDFSASAYGQVNVVCASLYPVERSFCKNRLGTSIIADLPADFAAGFGLKRIDAIQAFDSAAYFTDLLKEYAFLKELQGKEVVLTDGRHYQYKLVKNYAELEHCLQDADAAHETMAVVVTLEGAHAFGCGIDGHAELSTLKKNIETVKQWEYPPFFVTLAHHFFNELCGHAQSLTGIIQTITDQTVGLNTTFTSLGKEVVKLLLDTSNGKRIFIDIKHMSEEARQFYFDLLDTDYPNEKIPIVVSHGCVQGTPGKDAHRFNTAKINFSDQEILKVAETDGLFGIQLDERRIASDSLLQEARSFTKRMKVLFHSSALVWNQVQHIAELLDAHGHFAWGMMCLGTDFDGIIDPINGYWTYEDLPFLETYLLMHARNYLHGAPPLSPMNSIHEEEIVTRIMRSNAMDFFRKHFL